MAIKLQNISYKNILKGIDCEFEDGKIYAVLSSNELEKELLGQILAGDLNKFEGKITNDYNGKVISYVSRNNTFICDTVYNELKLPINIYKDETIQKKINFVLRMFKLDENIKYLNPNDLSSGEKKLLSLGIALITNPKILIVNEIKELDDYHRKIVIKLFQKMAKEYNKIIIIFTDDIALSYEACNNYLLIKNGKTISNLTKKNLFKNTDMIAELSIPIPKIIEFIFTVHKKKNIYLDITYDIKELMKDIYRNAK